MSSDRGNGNIVGRSNVQKAEQCGWIRAFSFKRFPDMSVKMSLLHAVSGVAAVGLTLISPAGADMLPVHPGPARP